MPLFAVYVTPDKKIGHYRVATNHRSPYAFSDLQEIRRKLFSNNKPPPVLWIVADDSTELEDKILEQYRSTHEFINAYGNAVY